MIIFWESCVPVNSDASRRAPTNINYWLYAIVIIVRPFPASPPGKIIFDRGDPLTGMVINDSNFEPPNDEYEITLKARKIDGRDFFCALTFPVPEKNSCCTFVAGAWGGQVTGLSNIDYLDANKNITRSTLNYDHDRLYTIRVEVTHGRIRCWIDKKLVVNCIIADKHISMRPGPIEKCQPFGLASIGVDVEEEMYRINPTAYIRVPFNVTAKQLEGLTQLTLRVKYD